MRPGWSTRHREGVFDSRRILVAGATGVIGRRVVAALAAGGDTVFGLARSDSSAALVEELGATAVRGDALDRAQVFAAVAEARPDVVIHQLTAIPKRPGGRNGLAAAFEATNRLRREGTRNLVEAAEEHGVQRLVAQSIAFAYRPEGAWVLDESAPLDTEARGAWGEIVGAVEALEAAVLAGRNFVGAVLRYGILYGPGTAHWHDGHVAELLRRRRLPIVGGGSGLRSFVHIDDAAGATLAALDAAAGIYNVVDDRPLAGREWIPAFAHALGAPPPRSIPAWLERLRRGERAVRELTVQRGASNARIRAELGWKPEYPDLQSGLAALDLGERWNG